ncbi:MAG: hypothetical protein ABIH92_02100, partial [Nanoarchaeota archaeon]
ARLKDPLLCPALQGVTLHEATCTKKISFPTAMLPDKESDETLWIYKGGGDKRIKYRSTSKKWFLRALREPDNLIRRKE